MAAEKLTGKSFSCSYNHKTRCGWTVNDASFSSWHFEQLDARLLVNNGLIFQSLQKFFHVFATLGWKFSSPRGNWYSIFREAATGSVCHRNQMILEGDYEERGASLQLTAIASALGRCGCGRQGWDTWVRRVMWRSQQDPIALETCLAQA